MGAKLYTELAGTFNLRIGIVALQKCFSGTHVHSPLLPFTVRSLPHGLFRKPESF